MSYLAIVLAAAAYAFGAAWYMLLARRWMTAAGLRPEQIRGPDGKPSRAPFVVSAVCMILVAAMMKHIFARSGVNTAGLGIFAGFGLGFFVATPWIATNHAFSRRPLSLTLIDGTYASVGCALMGLVLALF